MAVKPVPDGFHSVTPYLVVQGVPAVMDFMKAVFGTEEICRMAKPDGTVMHAEVRIGDSVIMLGEAPSPDKAMPSMLYVYLPDVDAAYQRALAAGATSVSEPADQFYGDRHCGVNDASGNQWWIATHVEDVPPEEMARRSQAAAHG